MVERRLLDAIGIEIIGIICPVSICMLLVVLLVKELQTEVTDTVLSSVASLVYSEVSTDSDWTKLLGALINAGVFVAFVTVVTFLLVLLFYFRCTKFLRGYMAVAAFTVLAYMGGTVATMLIQKLAIPIDVITAAIILYNFAIVGVLSMFLCRVPILVTQGYLVLVGMLVAFWFTSLPEWTTWVLLVAISLYDIVAVLTPGGPLNLLVKLAMTRDEEIPALIYEARPIISAERNSGQVMISTNATTRTSPTLVSTEENEPPRRWKRPSDASNNTASSLFRRALSSLRVPLLSKVEVQEESSECLQSLDIKSGTCFSRLVSHANQTTTIPPGEEEMQGNGEHHFSSNRIVAMQNIETDGMVNEHDEMRNGTLMTGTDVRLSLSNANGLSVNDLDDGGDDEGIGLGASGAIKLGLGDFIFYSVLVGRAALYDMTTVYACYLAIITGLGATLGLLAVWRRALPALPISIALGIIFYFLSRLLMEPFVMQNTMNLLFF